MCEDDDCYLCESVYSCFVITHLMWYICLNNYYLPICIYRQTKSLSRQKLANIVVLLFRLLIRILSSMRKSHRVFPERNTQFSALLFVLIAVASVASLFVTSATFTSETAMRQENQSSRYIHPTNLLKFTIKIFGGQMLGTPWIMDVILIFRDRSLSNSKNLCEMFRISISLSRMPKIVSIPMDESGIEIVIWYFLRAIIRMGIMIIGSTILPI